MSRRVAPLLVEIGCEELPARGLGDLARALASGTLSALASHGLEVDPDCLEVFWTPRRLSFIAREVPLKAPDSVHERRGPAVAGACDPLGAPGRALQGFAQSCGVPVEALQRLKTDKGEWYVHREARPGRPTPELLQEALEQAVRGLPITRPMRWGEGRHAFLRPVHWLLVLFDDQPVPVTLFDRTAATVTHGHRFHAPQAVAIEASADYVQLLYEARVMVKPDQRAAHIREDAATKALRTGGAAQISEPLLEELVNLTEWPVAVACEIPAEFMRLPPAVLITTIETHQRFLPIVADGDLKPWFIGVANIDSSQPGEIRRGYERVVRPRLADAAFFFDADLKTPLAEHQALLAKVAFQARLGTLWDKSERIASLAEAIAEAVGVDVALARRAALLSKCDLMTRMVGEFPELQGIMGRTYAEAQGEAPELALALEEIYSPRFAGAPIASSPLGRVLALADRLDTLACSFAIGAKPTGNKDPYSLRRAALGLARTLIEGGVPVDLHRLLEIAVLQVPAQTASDWFSKLSQVLPDSGPLAIIGRSLREGTTAPAVLELYAFIIDRLRAYYEDRGVALAVFQAVAGKHPHDLTDFDRRIQAVQRFQDLPEAAELAEAFKRARNLLRKAEGEKVPARPEPTLFELPAERALFGELELAVAESAPLLAERDYVAALSRLAGLRASVAAFFGEVMVMAPDAALRANRLALLQQLSRACNQVADLSELG